MYLMVAQNQEYDEVDDEKEKFCRVCGRGLGLIFCCKCPAAYHSECHNPPLQTRARLVLFPGMIEWNL